jgi:hypothetical protein
MKDYLGPTVLSTVLYECIWEKIRTNELSQRRVSDTEDRRRIEKAFYYPPPVLCINKINL